VTYPEFLRAYHARTANLMWFLGAGASAAASIPTADNLIWQFKRSIFCTQQRSSLRLFDDLSSENVRNRLNRYFAETGSFPSPGSPDEYAAYFEVAYPDANDRRAVLEEYVRGARPSYGHIALAALMKIRKVRIVWTVNFDRLIEDAAAKILGTTAALTVAALGNSAEIMRILNEGRWPILVKMHGDFQSVRLKNTPDELRLQDNQLRRGLVESCRRNGLIVVGYSGRDDSIMDALQQAAESKGAYPAGVFWFHRPDAGPCQRVNELLEKAKASGTQAELIEIETFDELLGDLLRQLDDLPTEIRAELDRTASRVSSTSLSPPGKAWPVIRTNGLPFSAWPNMARLVTCEIGGTKEVRDVIAREGGGVVGVRSKGGVLAFGSDARLRHIFRDCDIKHMDYRSIEPKRLNYDSAEMGLLRDAFEAALARETGCTVARRRSNSVLIPNWSAFDGTQKSLFRHCCDTLDGKVPGSDISWREALRLKLDFKLGRLWLLVEPTVYVSTPENETERSRSAEFIREKLARRYNRQWNLFLDAWISLLFDDARERTFRTFGIQDGVDAQFLLGRITGFSRLAIPQ
jgi:NAD-dependent SIR2 family protein deacetylase